VSDSVQQVDLQHLIDQTVLPSSNYIFSFLTRKAVLERLDHGARNRAAALAESPFSWGVGTVSDSPSC
jgi:hypothetical protein